MKTETIPMDTGVEGRDEPIPSDAIDGQCQSTQGDPAEQTARDCEPPEGHDRDYHLKAADGGDDHFMPIIKSLLSRDDVTLNEALVYGALLDRLGRNHTYCCPTQAEIARMLKMSVKTVSRAMAKLKAKGLVTSVFTGFTNRYYLPDRHETLTRLDGQGRSQSRSSGEGELGHTDVADAEARSQRPSSDASSVTVTDITNKEGEGEQREDGNEEGAASPPRPRAPSSPSLEYDRAGSSSSSERVVPGTAAGGQSRLDTPHPSQAAPGHSSSRPPAGAPTRLTPTEAIAVFRKEYQDSLGIKYSDQGKADIKHMADILTDDAITEGLFRHATRAMFMNDYARGRGAHVSMLAKNWNEWVLKGQNLSAYPMGQRIIIPRREHLDGLTSTGNSACTDEDIPAGHRSVDWNWFPAPVWQIVREAMFDRTTQSILLHGRPGTGKTSLAAASILYMRDLADQQHPGEPGKRMRVARFVSQAEFTRQALNTQFLPKREFGGSSNGATYGSMFVNEVMRFKRLLVLDDVVHAKGDRRLSPQVIEIINFRHAHQLKTIVTSNLMPAEIADKLDPAVASRLCGGLVLHSVGEDLRGTNPQEKEKASA